MKLKIYNETAEGQYSSVNLIDSAVISTSDIGLSILINTPYKWLHAQYTGANVIHSKENPLETHFTFSIFMGEDSSGMVSHLVVTPETDHEQALLSGMKYQLVEKDQIEFLVVTPVTKLMTKSHVANISTQD